MFVPASINDYRQLAKKRLPRQIFDLIDGGALDEVTLTANRADFQALRIRQRVLRDVSNLKTETRVLGQTMKVPVILAPIGLAGLAGRRGEAQGARAAEKAGVPFCLSTVSICSLEEIRQATNAPFWFQLYMMRDRGYVREMLQRAHVAGCGALLFTVDLAVLGPRYRDVRNGLTQGVSLGGKVALAWDSLRHFGWIRDVALGGRPLSFGNLAGVFPEAKSIGDVKKWVDSQFDPSFSWKDLAWVRENWSGPIVLKGILDPDDARAAADFGADGIVVSNHGGRQLDGAPSTISALPGIVDAVGDRLEVLIDGGIRGGQDVVKALALGARACLIGRAWMYGMAARGEQGITSVLHILKREIEITMALAGVACIEELKPDCLIPRN
ncbi:MAG: L-lactate dehydrogenase [Acidobacteria bacterium]|nr:L-lactate dehydrogenase [Acidobacteriota bacterium]